MVMFMLMVVFMIMVVIVARLVWTIHVNFQVNTTYGMAKGWFCSDVPWFFNRQWLQSRFNGLEICSKVETGTQEHVSGDSGERINV